jgi:hypothetical protein
MRISEREEPLTDRSRTYRVHCAEQIFSSMVELERERIVPREMSVDSGELQSNIRKKEELLLSLLLATMEESGGGINSYWSASYLKIVNAMKSEPPTLQSTS